MGQIITLKCKKCGKNIELRIGQGFRDNDIEFVIGQFNQSSAEKIKNEPAVSSGDAFWFMKRMVLAERSSKEVRSVPVFLVSEGSKTRIVAVSDECKGEYDLYDAEDLINGEKSVKCDICNENMSVEVTGYWD